MLIGRWMLFFGFIWAVFSLLVGSYANTQAGSDTTKLQGYVLSSAEFGRILVTGDSSGLMAPQDPLTSEESISLAGRIFRQGSASIENVYTWATWDYPILTASGSPVWGIVHTLWNVLFGSLFLFLGLWLGRQLLPFV